MIQETTPSKKIVRRAQPWLGTLVEIGCVGLDERQMNAACTAAFCEIKAIHLQFSFQDSASELSRLNAQPVGLPFFASSQLFKLLALCLALHADSERHFDPCVPHLGCIDCISINAALSEVTKTESCLIDLSGIAKGYAVDRAISALQIAGITSAWVNAGGDIRMYGANVPAIRLRLPDLKNTMSAIDVYSGAVASSGNYLQPAVAIINPRTQQAVYAQRAVTVAAPTCVIADALTKVGFFLHRSHPIFKQYDARLVWAN